MLLLSADNTNVIDETVDEVWWAWFAGLYEGEGNVSVTLPGRQKYGGRYIKLAISMTDKDVVERVYDRLGGSFRFKKRGQPHHKDQWSWQLSRRADVAYIAERILPYLGERRKHDLEKALADAQPGPSPRYTEEERFWSHVDKTEDHWIWNAYKDRFGFGTWCPGSNHGRWQAHRKVRELMDMKVPPRMKNQCGIKHCVRPDHWSPSPEVI